MFDAYNAVAKLNPGDQAGIDADVGYGNGPNATSLGIVVPGGHNLPYPTGFGPGGDAANFANPAYIGSHVLVESYNQNTDEINQLKLEGSWHDDQLKFKYGVQFTRDAETLRAFTDLPYTWQMYAGYGPPPVGSGGVAPIPANLISSYLQHRLEFHQRLGQRRQSAAEHHCRQWLCHLELPPGIERRGNERRCVQQFGRRTRPAPANTSCTRISAVAQDVTESTVSPYLSMALNEKIVDMPLKINFGARLEDTHVTSAGISSLPVGQLTIVPTDHTAYGFTPSPPVPISTESNYRYLLPNFDLGLE